LSSTDDIIEARSRARREQFAAVITGYVKVLCGIGVLPLLVLWLFYRPYIQILILAALLLGAAVVAGLYGPLSRRGYWRRAVELFIGMCLIVSFAEPILLRSVLPTVMADYALTVIMGHLVLGERGSRWLIPTVVLAFGANLALVQFDVVRWPVPLGAGVETAAGAFLNLFALIGTVLLLRLLMNEQESLFGQSQRASLAEQVQRRHLEDWIERFVAYMGQVRQGDLRARLALNGGRQADDPLETLGHCLNDTVADLQGMITQIHEATANLNAAAAEILASTAQQAAGTAQQSAAVAQTVTNVDEVKVISEQGTRRLQEVADAAQRTVDVSRSGGRAVQDAIASMEQMKAVVEGIAGSILDLAERTQQIGEIIFAANEIAGQLNMLALNASVEAARAGEHGKGFAVVAVEVRSLAQQSRDASERVRAILSDIQKATSAVVFATEEGTQEMDQGLKLAAEARQAISRLAEAIEKSAQIGIQIVGGGRQQLAGIEQMAQAMHSINAATAQNLASTRQAERAAQDLHELARRLAAMTEHYQL
jgi:methyl-accepting chemotaxis protein